MHFYSSTSSSHHASLNSQAFYSILKIINTSLVFPLNSLNIFSYSTIFCFPFQYHNVLYVLLSTHLDQANHIQ
jgi:hypothetical protein